MFKESRTFFILFFFQIFFLSFEVYGREGEIRIDEDLDTEAETYFLETEEMRLQIEEDKKRAAKERRNKEKAKRKAIAAVEKKKKMEEYAGQEMVRLDREIKKLITERKGYTKQTLKAQAAYDKLVLQLEKKKNLYQRQKKKKEESWKKRQKTHQFLGDLKKKMSQMSQRVEEMRKEKVRVNEELKNAITNKKVVIANFNQAQKRHKRVVQREGKKISQLKLNVKKIMSQVGKKKRRIVNLEAREKKLNNEIRELKKQVKKLEREKRKTDLDLRKHQIKIRALVKTAKIWRVKLESL